jgi:vacuolar-type H+-ATPase subunit I/STV1
MYPEKMLKVEVAVVSSKLEDLVKDLHEEGIIHFEIVKDLNWIKNAPPHSSIDLLSEKVKYIRDSLFIAKKIGLTFGIKSNKKYSKKILEDFINRHKEIVDLEKELEWVKGNLKTSKILEKFGIDNERFEQKRFLFNLYEVNFKHLEEIKKMSHEKNIDFDTIKISKHYYVLLSGGPEDKETFNLVAKENAMIPVTLEHIKSVKNTEIEIRNLKNQISKLHFDLRIELSDYYDLLKKDLTDFEIDLERAKVVSKFGKSYLTHYLKGWICKKHQIEMDNIFKKYKDYAVVYYEEPGIEELAPTKFNNHKLVKPFESLVTFLSIPKSNEIDPSLIFAIFLPLFFGFIMGDFGYSLIVLAAAYVARKKFKENSFGRNLLTIICYSSIWGILFGILFAEGFGFELEYELLGVAFPIIRRINDVLMLFIISLAFGFIHMLLGYTLGAIETYKKKRMREFYINVVWIVMQLSWLLMALGFVDIGLIIMGISTLFVLYFNGLMGILDISSLFGNIVSYVRLGAVGLSGVIFALIIGMIKPEVSHGILIIVTTILFVVFNILTIVISVYSGLIQSGRLHAVECLSKFFEGGGYYFEPFCVTRNEEEKK